MHEGDRRHARFMEGAGAGDPRRSVHAGGVSLPKKNWGHSTYEYAVELAAAASVRQLVLTHHDPTHDDAFVEELEKRAREYAEAAG